ncbi:MAG TPA: Ldh family oxidoreductase [Amycolatopsis sp.]|nr:Ldh family oxidoreductase [Amycolatopsis sp.]
MTGDTQITAEDLRGLAARALAGNGMAEEDAARVTDVLVLADLFGIRTHGVARIPQYLDRARVGGVDLHAKVTVDPVAPALSRVDGANGIGPLVGSHALDAALAGARATGLGAAFVRGSNHFGPVMPYLFRAAEQGFAAVIASNATTTIAPWGGREARLGNNPLGIGVPSPGGDPVLLDIAMSVAARAKIRAAAAEGRPIPATWATDSDGHPTTDPAAALDGFLQPLGGHKGYGLSVMIDLFTGVLSGAGYLTRISSWSADPERPQNLGHIFFLIDTSRLVTAADLTSRMTDFTAILRTTPPADPAQPVRVPGELELARYHRHLRDGLAVDTGVLTRLLDLAGAVR